MPIKKHIQKVKQIENQNILTIPKSICDAIGIGDESVVRVFSNNNGYSFTVETMLSYENAQLLEQVKQSNLELKEYNKVLKDENVQLKQQIETIKKSIKLSEKGDN